MVKRLYIWLLCVLCAACATIETEVTIRPDEIGVLVESNTSQLTVLPPGTYTLDLARRVFFYPTFTQIYKFNGEANPASDAALATGAPLLSVTTADNRVIQLGLDVVFRINPEAVLVIHETWSSVPGDYRAGYIYNTVRIVARSVMSNYTAAQLATLAQADLQRALTIPLQAEFAENGFILDRVAILALNVPADVPPPIPVTATASGN